MNGVEDSFDPRNTLAGKWIGFCLKNKLVVLVVTGLLIFQGLRVAPFDFELSGIERNPVPVDAIPDVGENQQIVFAEWEGRSPRDVEDQITYRLTVSLLGVPGVRTIRAQSNFGFSTVYVVFNEDVDFYESRTRILEKLSSLPPGLLPTGVKPVLGPDATALGQIFWYTLEGRDQEGEAAGGWNMRELRTVQDFRIRYELMSVPGVSEVASIGGFVKEIQVDVDPAALHVHKVDIQQVFNAVRKANAEVGARSIEINGAEYLIRGVGFLKSPEELELTVVKESDNAPLLLRDVATVTTGPAMRRGILEKAGAEAVGGVVVARYGENPMKVIQGVKKKLKMIAASLPEKQLSDGRVSKVTVVPFYDRSGLIQECLGTLYTAISEEILVTILVVVLMLMQLRSAVLISGLLPVSVLLCFIAMKLFEVPANVVALSGIAIAIGTIVDMGIVICESIMKKLDESPPGEHLDDQIHLATAEVGGAVFTAVATTLVSFLPVFAMEGAEAKLFLPLAFTKTYVLIAAILLSLTVLPVMAQLIYRWKLNRRLYLTISILGGLLAAVLFMAYPLVSSVLFTWSVALLLSGFYRRLRLLPLLAVVCWGAVLLAEEWLPLGVESSAFKNTVFVSLLVGGLLSFFTLYSKVYGGVLNWCLSNKMLALSPAVFVLVFGLFVWKGASFFLAPVFPDSIESSRGYKTLTELFPGLGREFMPRLDEGSFLYMPTTMPHASIGQASELLKKIDMAIESIPEVESVVGKIGRVDSALDPAPVSMVETVINYYPEYKLDKNGRRLRFQVNWEGDFVRDQDGELIIDPDGVPFRQWGDDIHSPQDIWNKITEVAKLPGVTSAPLLQPIETRIVMLQSGMRAPVGIKISGPDLNRIESFALQLETLLKNVEEVEAATVNAERIVGKPYLEIHPDREALARHGLSIMEVQNILEVALGGKTVTWTVEGRERYPVRVRYKRELRDSLEGMEQVLIPAGDGVQIPLSQIATIQYRRGPMAIKSENTRLVSYLTFGASSGMPDTDLVELTRAKIESAIQKGQVKLPEGVSYEFAGSYQNQLRAEKKLAWILPVSLLTILLLLYLQFRSIAMTGFVFVAVFVAWGGGFMMLWLYAQPWFLDFEVFSTSMRDLFQVRPFHLSVAVWVGFLALFGIATDDGVLISSYIQQSFLNKSPATVEEVRLSVLEAGKRRIRPCLMTSATTVLALLPVLSSTGKGAGVMLPMALPSFGGMIVVLISTLVVPVLNSWRSELQIKRKSA